MALLELLTGIVALVTAALATVLVVLGRRKFNQIEKKTDEIHVLVNSRLTAVLERVEQLTSVLEAENMPVPEPPRADKHLR